jgi:tRNA U34 5-methylaminomethyl-2-thiouridine-forming methyltransferase MnmC
LGTASLIEFKNLRFSKALGPQLCALANTVGGRVILGVDDKGEVVGFRRTDRLLEQIQTLSNQIEPSPLLNVNSTWVEQHQVYIVLIEVFKSEEWTLFKQLGWGLDDQGLCTLFRDQWEYFWKNRQEIVGATFVEWSNYLENQKGILRSSKGFIRNVTDLKTLPRTLQIKTTADGSPTLVFEELGETFHSSHGALSESLHVFIEQGLLYGLERHNLESGPFRILEVGFGTGLNAGLSLETLSKQTKDTCVFYCGLEPYPVSWSMIEQLDFQRYWSESTQRFFETMHRGNSDVIHKPLTNPLNFEFKRMEISIQDFWDDLGFDLIYFDAFAPDRQHEMWNQDVLGRCHQLLNPGGILVTYCANGEFKRVLRSVGFEVAEPAGPAGRRVMVQATKK